MAMKTVALLHPGEMGSAIGACLGGLGLRVVWASAGRSAATRSRANAAGLEDLGVLEPALGVAAIDERRLGGFDHAADSAYRRGRDRVRVDIDAAEAVAGNLAGERKRAVRRTHRQYDVGRAERTLERAEIFEPRGFGAGARRRAAPRRRPNDPQAESAQAGADCGAHLTGMKQRDCFHCHARVNGPA